MDFKPPPPPDGCRTAEEHERELVKSAELLEGKARVLLESDARIGLATANQMILASIKARKEASVIALARESRDHSTWLMSEYKKLKGLHTVERPRLRRRPG